MQDTIHDAIDAVPSYQSTKEHKYVHGVVTGNVCQTPELKVVKFRNKTTGEYEQRNVLHFKIRSNRVSKKLAYILGTAEGAEWTDKHENTYFDVNIWEVKVINFTEKKHLKLNQKVAVTGFINSRPKDKDGKHYPNFNVHASLVLS